MLNCPEDNNIFRSFGTKNLPMADGLEETRILLTIISDKKTCSNGSHFQKEHTGSIIVTSYGKAFLIESVECDRS